LTSSKGCYFHINRLGVEDRAVGKHYEAELAGQRLQYARSPRHRQDRKSATGSAVPEPPEHSNVDGDRSPRIGDRFLFKFRFVYLKIVRQHGGVARKASDPAIGVLQNYDVELPAPSSPNFY
jgi:hypothetical protein